MPHASLPFALLGEGHGANLWLAWGYVDLRVMHSLFQVLINKIEIRFVLFVLSTLMLFGMVFNAFTADAVAQLAPVEETVHYDGSYASRYTEIAAVTLAMLQCNAIIMTVPRKHFKEHFS